MNIVERMRKGEKLIALGRSQGKDTSALETEVASLISYLEVELHRLWLLEFEILNIV